MVLGVASEVIVRRTQLCPSNAAECIVGQWVQPHVVEHDGRG
jgi:hypothetical protein